MTFINNLTTLFSAFSPAVQTRPAFKGNSLSSFVPQETGTADSFSTNPIYSYLGTEAEITELAKSSPEIMGKLKQYGIPLNVNMDVLEDMR